MFALDLHTILFIYQIRFYKQIENGYQMSPVARTAYKTEKKAHFDQCVLSFLETLPKLLIKLIISKT